MNLTNTIPIIIPSILTGTVTDSLMSVSPSIKPIIDYCTHSSPMIGLPLLLYLSGPLVVCCTFSIIQMTTTPTTLVKSELFCRCLQVDQAGMNSSNSAGPTSKLRSSYLLPASHSKPGF